MIVTIILIIHFRTKSLKKSNQQLKEKQRIAIKIQQQKEELDLKNQNITSSLNYAKRILDAMLPSEKFFNKILPDSFLFFKPKDIVSGDFYWISEQNGKVFVAAVDCTGHGVPGALMSIIGFDILENIIHEQKIENPAQILNRLSHGIAYTFNKEGQSDVKDGMDIALCVIDQPNKKLEYAGAFNPLYLIRENNLTEIKGDRFSVGMLTQNLGVKFKKHDIDLQKGDFLYIFSDGYADQFGGPKQKKFKYRRFRHLLLNIHQKHIQEQKEFLDKSLAAWQGNLEQVDDILIIGINPNISRKQKKQQ